MKSISSLKSLLLAKLKFPLLIVTNTEKSALVRIVNYEFTTKRLICVTALGAFGLVMYHQRMKEHKRKHLFHLKYLPPLITCQLEAKHRTFHVNSDLPSPIDKQNLPTYSLKEVKLHGKDAERIWVTFKQGVYDVTDFINLHPGGDKILMAAGTSIEPFWEIYAQHKTEEVFEILEELRIGNLSEEDFKALETDVSANDPYADDPPRHPALIVNMEKPFNAETPSSLLTDSFLTPKQLFFVRNHMPVPKTSEETHRVRIDGIGVDKPLYLSMKDIRNNFEPVTIVSTIQCAGNRRNDMNQFKKVQGLMWTGTAISNAKWKGVRLRDVLISAGIKPNDKSIKHVQFEGADVDSSDAHYGASITFEKAMSPEVLLAFEMNDEVLTRDHGFPVRLIVPGIVGARQVKWLTGIRTSSEESNSNWQRRDYKAFPNSIQIGDPLPYETTPSIQEYPVQSAICTPLPNSKIVHQEDKAITVSGYAWSGGGRGIIRVEVSSDGGKTWRCAELEQFPGQDLEHMWAWTLWKIELPMPEKKGNLEIVCKATDRAYNTQSETPSGLWNVRGLLHNAWHRVPISVG